MVFLNFKKVLAAIVRSKETKALSNGKLIKQSKYEIASLNRCQLKRCSKLQGIIRFKKYI